MPSPIRYGSFIYKPLGLPNPQFEDFGEMTVGALVEMEVEIVNTMLSGAFARGANPSFIVRSH